MPSTPPVLARREIKYAAARSWILRCASSRMGAVLLAGGIPLLVRLALLIYVPVPVPSIHDEFSYLLAADTFTQGRLANPPHPLWQFFETFHVLQQPSYASMYPPMQGLVLAFGTIVFGHPFWGVCLSVAAMCALLCWVLQEWVSPRWALAGSLLVAAKFGITWANSYWGGAAAAIGACLLLGSLLHLRRPHRDLRLPSVFAILMGIGVAILANSRPWEGALLAVPVGIAFVRWILTSRFYTLRFRMMRIFAPCCAVLILTAGAMAYYCWRVTGSPTTLPYLLNRRTYAVAPLFVWQTPGPVPPYRHEAMRRFYAEWEPTYRGADQAMSFTGWLKAKTNISTLTVLVALLVCAGYLRYTRMRFLAVLLAVFLSGLAVQRYVQPHYLAPILPAVAIVCTMALHRLSRWRLTGRPIGRVAAAAALVFAFAWSAYGAVKNAEWRAGLFGGQRIAVERQLAAMPGKHLVLVRYSPTHSIHDEWVYNAADINGAGIVWARDMGAPANARLLNYFAGHSMWCLTPDPSPLLKPLATGDCR